MPILNLFEELDILIELQFPDFVYATSSDEEKIAFSKYINSFPSQRILLISATIFNFYFVVAGLKEIHIETLLKDGDHNTKKMLFFNMSTPGFLSQVSDFVAELDRRDKTTENSTRLKNILQYLSDNKYII